LGVGGGMARATFYVVVGGTRDEVYGVLRAVRAGRVDQQQAATESWWSDFLRPAHLPDTDDPSIRGFARRALIATRTATDNASGAIVAGVATQPPSGFGLPRGGSLINPHPPPAG